MYPPRVPGIGGTQTAPQTHPAAAGRIAYTCGLTTPRHHRRRVQVHRSNVVQIAKRYDAFVHQGRASGEVPCTATSCVHDGVKIEPSQYRSVACLVVALTGCSPSSLSCSSSWSLQLSPVDKFWTSGTMI